MHSGDCRVEYFYIWPENAKDDRTRLTELVRTSIMQGNNLHNHPLHKENKIPVKTDTNIRRAVIGNPHLKTADVL